MKIHFTGCGYYYTIKDVQVSKMYKTKWALERWGKIQYNKETKSYYY